MTTTTTTLTARGQLTLPMSIRERLGVRPGDLLEFQVTAEGKVLLEPARGDLRRLRGILKAPRDRHLSLEGIDEVIRRPCRPLEAPLAGCKITAVP